MSTKKNPTFIITPSTDGNMPSPASSPKKNIINNSNKSIGNMTAKTSSNTAGSSGVETPKKNGLTVRSPYETPVSSLKVGGASRRPEKSNNLTVMGLNPNANTFIGTPHLNDVSPTLSRSSLSSSRRASDALPTETGSPKQGGPGNGSVLKAGVPDFKPKKPIVLKGDKHGQSPQGWNPLAVGHSRSFSDTSNYSPVHHYPMSSVPGAYNPPYGHPTLSLHTSGTGAGLTATASMGFGKPQYLVPTASPIAPPSVYPNSNIFQVQRKVSKKLEIKKPTDSPFAGLEKTDTINVGLQVHTKEKTFDEEKKEGGINVKGEVEIHSSIAAAEGAKEEEVDLHLKLKLPALTEDSYKGEKDKLISGVADVSGSVIQAKVEVKENTLGVKAHSNKPYPQPPDNVLRELNHEQYSNAPSKGMMTSTDLKDEINPIAPELEDEEDRLIKRALKQAAEVREIIAADRPQKDTAAERPRVRPTVWNAENRRWEYVDSTQASPANTKRAMSGSESKVQKQTSQLNDDCKKTGDGPKPVAAPSVGISTIQRIVTIYSVEYRETSIESSPSPLRPVVRQVIHVPKDAPVVRQAIHVPKDATYYIQDGTTSPLYKMMKEQEIKIASLTDYVYGIDHRLHRLEGYRHMSSNNQYDQRSVEMIVRRLAALEAEYGLGMDDANSAGSRTPTPNNRRDVDSPETLYSAYSEADFDTFAERMSSTPVTPAAQNGQRQDQAGGILLNFS